MPDDNPYAPPEADITVNEPGNLANRGARLGGAIVDGLLMALIIWPLMFATGYWELAASGTQTYSAIILMTLSGIGVFLLLNGYLLANHGQTIGKRLLNMRIVSIRDDNILPFWKLVVFRYLPVWFIPQVPILGQLLGLIDPLCIFRKDRRCLHDLIAGTKVVKVNTA